MSLAGLVLCGGKSSRMGSDKGLMLKNNQTWASLMIYKLSYFCDVVYISINESQIQKYSSHFQYQNLIVDVKIDAGPMAGLVSFSKSIPSSNVLVMPCDMTDFSTKNVEILINNAQNYTNFNCFAFMEDGFVQPFPCIINKEILTNKIETYKSVVQLLKSNTLLAIPINKSENAFKNYNSATDLLDYFIN